MSLEDAGTVRVKDEPEWEDSVSQALQIEQDVKEGDWAAQDDHIKYETKDTDDIDCKVYDKSSETVAHSSRMVKEELVVWPEEHHQPKHIVQSHEPKPQDDYYEQEIMTPSIFHLIIQSQPVRETLHKCDHCSYVTDSEENLKQHEKIHYICVYCRYTAASEVSLLLHVSTHASEKPKTYARRTYAGKRGKQNVQGGLYTKHGVKEESVDKIDTHTGCRDHKVKAEPGSGVSSQAGYVECKVKEQWEYTAATSLHTIHGLKEELVEGSEEFQNQLLARQKEVLESKAGTQALQAGMCIEHKASSEPASKVCAQAGHIDLEVKEEPGSEIGLQAAHAGLYTKQQVKEEPANGTQACMDHVVKEECISENAAQLEPASEEGIQAGHVKQGSDRGTGTKAALIYEVKEEPANEVGTQVDRMELEVKEECISEKAAQAEPESEEGVQAAHVMQVSERETGTKAALIYEVKEEPANEAGTQACLEHVVKEECLSEKAAQAEPESEEGVQAGHVTHVSERGTDTKAALIYEVKEEPANGAGTRARLEHVVKEECMSDKAAQAEPEREEGGQAGPVTRVCGAAEREVQQEAGGGVCAREGEGGAAAARAALYAGHEVKEELVLGPEEVHTPKQLLAVSTRQKEQNGQPMTKSVMNRNSLTLHSTPVTEKSNKCYESLKDNEKEHTGKTISYNCAFCSFVSANIKDLKSHQMIHIGEEAYKCTFCNFSSALKRDLKVHIRTHHSNEKPYKCSQCSYASAHKKYLVAHVRKHTGEKPYKCTDCSYVCAHSSKLSVHKNRHSGYKPYKCALCSYTSYQKHELKSHERKHTGEKVYKCIHCNFACNNRGYLKVHARKHTGEKPYKCAYCDYETIRKIYLEIHVRKHTGEKPYKCIHCDLAYSTKCSLQVHLNSHSDVRYKCAFCSFVTASKSSLRHHKRRHTAEKVYKCAHCSYASAYKYPFIIHERMHTGEKPYKCTYCDYACVQKSQLKFHETWTHTDKEPYKCASCSFTTRYKFKLQYHEKIHVGKAYKCAYCEFASAYERYVMIHERTHTGEKLYKCAHCSHTCARLSNLKNHEKTHSSEKLYRCAHCNFTSVLKCYLRRHLKRRHTK